jgi:signal transduction histidine kinase
MSRLVSDDRIKNVVDMIIHQYNSENIDLARQLYNSTKHVLINQNAIIDLEKLNYELGDLLPKITHVGGKRKSRRKYKLRKYKKKTRR